LLDYILGTSTSLPDEPNNFYVQFEADGTPPVVKVTADYDSCPLLLLFDFSSAFNIIILPK